MPNGPNIFARLHKWATRQDENFLTESFAVILEHLLILTPEVGTRLVHQLTNGFINVRPEDAGAIVIRAQVETGKGRPDLEMCVPDRLVWIEVKAESELRTGQLEGYRELLGSSGFEQTQLILLTRYPETFSTAAARPDLAVRWFQVADWLESEIAAVETSGKVASYLARQFLDFLRIRGMTLTQVGKFMPEGVRALGNLLDMLIEAAAACKVSAKRSVGRAGPGRDYICLILDRKYWVGIYFAEPEKLCFQTWCRIDPEAAVRLGVGELGEQSWIPGRSCWQRAADLDSEDVHFYSRTKVGQFRWLEGFLRDCLAIARRIEVPGEPDTEPEGDDTDRPAP